MAELRGWTRFVALQIEYSLALRDVERELIPMAEAMGIGVLPWSPLAAGVLTGKYTREDLKRQEEAADAELIGSEKRAVFLTEKKLAIAEAVVEVARETERSPAQVALNWLLTRDSVTSPILGARTVRQIEDNLGALEFRLDDRHLERLDEVSAIELGFPHDFVRVPRIRELMTGGAYIEA